MLKNQVDKIDVSGDKSKMSKWSGKKRVNDGMTRTDSAQTQ